MSHTDPIIDKIIIARVSLLLKHPFFGNMATRLKIQEGEDWLPTAATDGRHIYFNRGFFEKLTVKQVEFVIAHEILHNVFDHMGRRESRNAKIFNIAADYCVNGQLVRDRIGDHNIPDIKIFHDQKYYGMGAEEVYDQIYDEMDEKELYLYNKRRGFDLDSLLDGTSPYIDKSAEYLGEGKDFLGKGLFQNYASGGIASLTDTIPPKSGPTPHGLPYVYNNVKKI